MTLEPLGHRWAIEDSFETGKNEFGLDHNETRSWHGWHRHVSLVMLAYAMMVAIRRPANAPAPKKMQRRAARIHSTSSAQAKTHRARLCHRVVTLAASSSGRRSEIRYETKITTVVLGRVNKPLHKGFPRRGNGDSRLTYVLGVSLGSRFDDRGGMGLFQAAPDGNIGAEGGPPSDHRRAFDGIFLDRADRWTLA
jgi:hypothetical protein